MLTNKFTIGLAAAMLIAALSPVGAQEVSLRMSVNDRPDGHTAVMARDLADGVARRTNNALNPPLPRPGFSSRDSRHR